MDKKFLASSKKKIRTFFAAEFKKFGDSYEAVNWGSQASQYARFDVLSAIGELDGSTLLDVGCGLGEFLKYLQMNDKKVNYTGVDICDEMIEGAQARFKKAAGVKFKTGDVLEAKNTEKYDYVISSGAFNINLGVNDKMIKDILQKMLQMSKKAAAVSMLSKYADFTEEVYYYYDPAEIFEFCKSICKKVTLRHDYMTHDFTIIMYK